MLPRFQHLLVPVDFTEKTRTALDIAFEIAVQNKARVTLLHVVEAIEGDDPELRTFIDRLKQRAESDLAVRVQRFIDAGVTADCKVRYGRRLQEIVQDVRDRKIDLIVMSSHPIDSADPLRSWGTISYQVSVLCDCPILLVK